MLWRNHGDFEYHRVLIYLSIGVSVLLSAIGFIDNIFIERLWRSVKYEEIYVNEFQSVKQLRKSLEKYFDFYNNERPHQSFDGQIPAEIYYGKKQLRLVGWQSWIKKEAYPIILGASPQTPGI